MWTMGVASAAGLPEPRMTPTVRPLRCSPPVVHYSPVSPLVSFCVLLLLHVGVILFYVRYLFAW